MGVLVPKVRPHNSRQRSMLSTFSLRMCIVSSSILLCNLLHYVLFSDLASSTPFDITIFCSQAVGSAVGTHHGRPRTQSIVLASCGSAQAVGSAVGTLTGDREPNTFCAFTIFDLHPSIPTLPFHLSEFVLRVWFTQLICAASFASFLMNCDSLISLQLR